MSSGLGKAIVEVMASWQNPCGATHACEYHEPGTPPVDCIFGAGHMSSDGSKGPHQCLPDGTLVHSCCYGHEWTFTNEVKP